MLKLLIPAGYMIGSDRGRITIAICSGGTPRMMTMELPGMTADVPDHGKSKDHGKAETPCAFSGLSTPMLGAIDPIQFAALIAFVLALGLIAVVRPAASRATAYLRPPLRGPPAHL